MSPNRLDPNLGVLAPDLCPDCGGGCEHADDCPVLSQWDEPDPDDEMDLRDDREDAREFWRDE